MDSELNSQKQTIWEFDHHTKRMTEYGPQIAKAKVDITVLKQHLINVGESCLAIISRYPNVNNDFPKFYLQSCFFLLFSENGCKLCPPDWIWVNSMCYLIPFTGKFGQKTWPHARSFCKQHGGDLAVLDSKDKEVHNQHIVHVYL